MAVTFANLIIDHQVPNPVWGTVGLMHHNDEDYWVLETKRDQLKHAITRRLQGLPYLSDAENIGHLLMELDRRGVPTVEVAFFETEWKMPFVPEKGVLVLRAVKGRSFETFLHAAIESNDTDNAIKRVRQYGALVAQLHLAGSYEPILPHQLFVQDNPDPASLHPLVVLERQQGFSNRGYGKLKARFSVDRLFSTLNDQNVGLAPWLQAHFWEGYDEMLAHKKAPAIG